MLPEFPFLRDSKAKMVLMDEHGIPRACLTVLKGETSTGLHKARVGSKSDSHMLLLTTTCMRNTMLSCQFLSTLPESLAQPSNTNPISQFQYNQYRLSFIGRRDTGRKKQGTQKPHTFKARK